MLIVAARRCLASVTSWNNNNDLIFMQDDATPHLARTVQEEWLHVQFQDVEWVVEIHMNGQ